MKRRYTAIVDGKETVFELDKTGEESACLAIQEKILNLDIATIGDGRYSIIHDGHSYAVDVGRKGDKFQVTYQGEVLSFSMVDERQRRKSVAVAGEVRASGDVVSPMPGKVVRVHVEAGQKVKTGDGIVVVEAMKMENEFKSPRNGIVKSVKVKVGDSVEGGTILAVIG